MEDGPIPGRATIKVAPTVFLQTCVGATLVVARDVAPDMALLGESHVRL